MKRGSNACNIEGRGTRLLVPHSVSNLLGGDLSLLGRKTDTTFAEGV